MYLYNAALWCDACGRKLCETLPTPEGYDASDEHTWDSDDFPKYADEDYSETDSPSHCDAGAECLDAIEIAGERYGALIRESLTDDGAAAVAEARGPVADFWREEFGISSPDVERAERWADDYHPEV